MPNPPYPWIPTRDQHPQYQLRREMSIEDLLLENRIIYLGYPIGPDMAKFVIQRLLYLQSTKRDQEISLYVNSPGGYVDQTLAIYDTMQYLTCEVATYCIGTAASGAKESTEAPVTTESSAESEKDLLSGPQVPGAGNSQEEIDALLASFN